MTKRISFVFDVYLPYGYLDGEWITGAALQQCGLIIPGSMEEYQAWQIHLIEEH